MSNRTYWMAPLGPLNSADGTPATGTGLADISPAPQKVIPADWLDLGTIMRLSARGEYTCGSTATNAALGFYVGGVAGALLMGVTAQALTVSQTAVPWWMVYEGNMRALGASGSVKGMGWLKLGTSLTAWTEILLPVTAAARILTFSTVVRQPITVGASVSQTVGAPSVTCYDLIAEFGG